MTFDVETSGLGIYDQVRSLAASTIQVQHNGEVTNLADGFGAHFLTPQMQQYKMRDPSSGNITRLGTGVYGIEKADGDSLADLTTKEGRIAAVEDYKKFFRQALEADYVAGYNVQFDIQRVAMSVAGLEEFSLDKEAVELHRRFVSMVDEGRVINTLDLVRNYLGNDLISQLEAEGVFGKQAAEISESIMSRMFSPEIVAKTRVGGAATPFSIGNIAGTTNLLELIEQSGEEGRVLVSKIAGTSTENSAAAHMANVDVKLTNYMMQFINTGKLRYGFQGSAEARSAILRASAAVPTTNIADIQHMSDAVYNYSKSDKGLQRATLATERGFVKYDKSSGKFYEYASDGSDPQEYLEARQKISQAIEDSRAGRKSDLIDSGINYVQQTRAESILANAEKLQNISTNVSSITADMIRTGEGLDEVNERAFLEALTGTRELLGFNYYNYRPEILSDKGMTRLMPEVAGVIDDTVADNYLTRLAAGGIGTAIEDASLRRSFVELATITSGLPFVQSGDQGTGGLGRRIIEGISDEGATEEEIAERISLFNAQTGKKISPYLSELGVSFAETQRTNYLFGKSGEISRPAVSADILKNIDVTIGGRKVGFLSQEFLQDYGANRFGLSVTDTPNNQFVNVVFGNLAADVNSGQQVVNRNIAKELAEGLYDQMSEKIGALSNEDLINEGFAESEMQVKEMRRQFSEARRAGDEGRLGLVSKIEESIVQRGLSVGKIQGKEAQGVIALLEQVAGGLDNDTVAFQKAMQFAISEYGDDFVALQARVDETSLEIIEAKDPTLARRIRSGELMQEAYDKYQATLGRAEKDRGFAGRLARIFSERRVDSGIGGTRFARDEAVRAMYKKAAPKVGIGVLAVGALSAGYYIAKKNREKDLYDQTTERQPTEGFGQNAQLNDSLISSYPQTSTRRDPLVTAGVVGNLDRNKIGHTTMGPNKYDHLYR